jgi:hypothetical protein
MRLKYLELNGMFQMSADKEKLSQLVEKIDELLSVLKDVSEDLKTVSASVKSLAVSQITSKPSVTTSSVKTPAPTSRSAPSTGTEIPVGEKSQSIEDLRMMFPEDLDHMLSFEEKGEYVIIKPKQFLGSENFAKIASTVRGMGGEYISAGRDSHFRVYKKKP